MDDPWKDLLGQGEKILWQGTPKVRIRLEWDSPFVPIFNLFTIGFSVFWISVASQSDSFFWLFGLLTFFVGFQGLIGEHFWKAFVRTQQHYTLTNRRAIIGTAMFGRKTLESYPISKTAELTLEEADETGSIYFATKERKNDESTKLIRVGFEQIENPRQVMSIIRQIQENRQV